MLKEKQQKVHEKLLATFVIFYLKYKKIYNLRQWHATLANCGHIRVCRKTSSGSLILINSEHWEIYRLKRKTLDLILISEIEIVDGRIEHVDPSDSELMFAPESVSQLEPRHVEPEFPSISVLVD